MVHCPTPDIALALQALPPIHLLPVCPVKKLTLRDLSWLRLSM
jgi:hypothetical protein